MKKELVISLVLVIVVIGGILLSMQKKPASTEQTSSSTSKETVAKHNTKDDCWVIVNNNVFNVTSYIPNHPAGPDIIISVCGQDATALFTSRNGKGPHPDKVQASLNQMLVGSLAQ